MAKSRVALDLKQFKHVKTDKDTTTLKHKDGHVLTVAHKAMSPENRKALEALACEPMPGDKDQSKQDKQMLAGGGEPTAPSTFLGIPIYGTGTSKKDLPAPVTDPDKAKEVSNYEKGSKPAPEGKAKGGEIRKMYANPDEAVAPDDSAPAIEVTDPKDANIDVSAPDPIVSSSPMQPEQAIEQPKVPADKAQIQSLYNSLVSSVNPTATSDRFNPGAPAMNFAKFGPNGEPPQAFDANKWQQAESLFQNQQAISQNVSQNKVAEVNAANEVRARAGLPPMPVPEMNMQKPPEVVPQEDSVPSQPMGEQQIAPQQEAPPAQPGGLGDPMAMLDSAYKNRMAGAAMYGNAAVAQQAANLAIEHNAEVARTNAAAAYKSQYDALEAERKSHIQDIQDGYIDPEKYWTGDANGKGGHSKIATAIGMIIGGFNPTNKPNGAIEFLKYQMDRNLDAQKQNLGAKQNLLMANLHQFHNLKDATDMTRLMQADVVQAQLAQAAAKAGSPMAKAAALDAQGKIQAEFAPLAQQFAMRKAMMNLSNSNDPQAAEHMLGYMRVVNPEMAKEMETRLVPGVGMASVPVSEKVRGQLVAHKDVNDIFNRVLEFAKKHQGSLDPKVRAEGAALMNEAQSKLRVAEDQGVYKKSEAEFMSDTMGSNPANFLAKYTTVPKIRQLQALKQNEYNNLLSGVGIRSQQLPQAQTGPKEGDITTRGGIKYMRVHGGWQKVK